jgi:hypothetical protein
MWIDFPKCQHVATETHLTPKANISPVPTNSSFSTGAYTEPNDGAYLNAGEYDVLGAYPIYSRYTMPTSAQHLSCLGDQTTTYDATTGLDSSSPVAFNRVPHSSLDWDRMMFGAELDQQWNFVIRT